ncbi:hypothetical protein L340_3248 [Escherichia coli E2265]|nr:hypothetical protein L340_3248 [Escherichia coli E2265]ESV04063.1 hypothetical protein L339_02317 [Escherichia coli E1777]
MNIEAKPSNKPNYVVQIPATLLCYCRQRLLIAVSSTGDDALEISESIEV